MIQLSHNEKELLEEGVQSLRKAEFLDERLQLTCAGIDALNLILFKKHKKEMIVLAREKNKEGQEVLESDE